MKKYYSSAILLVALLLGACVKRDESQIVRINTGLKAVYDYGVGSYWVYRDSLTGKMDSFAVTERSTFVTKDEDEARDRIGCFMTEYYNGNIADKSVWQWELFENSVNLLLAYRKPGTPALSYTAYQLFDFPLKVHAPVQTPWGSYSVDTIFSSFTIQGKHFTDVAQITVVPSGSGSQVDTYLLSAEAGLLKMAINRPAEGVHYVWELMRWRVVR